MEKNKKKKLRPQDRWDAKAGIVAKTYKIDKEVAENFKTACRQAGIGMGPQLTIMMQDFIDKINA